MSDNDPILSVSDIIDSCLLNVQWYTILYNVRYKIDEMAKLKSFYTKIF